MRKKIILGVFALLLILQAKMVFAADYDEDFLKAVSKNDFSDMEKILERRSKQMHLSNCMVKVLTGTVSGFNKNNTIRVLEMLIKYGAKIKDDGVLPLSTGNFYIEPPLNIVLLYNKYWDANNLYNVVQYLLKNGANPNGGDNNPLLNALETNNQELIKLLINNGADIDKRDRNENTPLMFTSSKGNFAIVKLLVENGAKINLRNKNGETAASIAYDKGEMDIYDFLKDNGARDFEPRQVTQQPAPAQSSTTNVFVQPSAPAQSNSAPPQTASTGWNLSVMSGTNNIGGTWTSSVGKGNFIVLNGTGTSGSVNIQINGKSRSGTASISGNTLDLYITSGEFKGQQFRYTIVSNKLIQGDGENFNRY